MVSQILEKIEEWLKQGSPDAEHIVDLPWYVIRDEELNGLFASTPPYPVALKVFHIEKADTLRLVIETRIKTVYMDNDKKLRLYHYLLAEVNGGPYVKSYLFGSENEIALSVDIPATTITKEEFDDMLSLLLASLGLIYDRFGTPEDAKKETIYLLYMLIRKWYEQGWAKSRLKKLLMRGGMDEEEADELINEILSLGEEGDKEKRSIRQGGGGTYIM